MNPDGTNPTNTGAGASTGGAVVPPALDFTSSDTTNLSMADSLASAADNLTSAGMAAKEPDNGSIEMGEIGASDPSATMERPDEPLIPAAPVPGSIGSVTSGPAVGTSNDASAAGFGAGVASGFGASAGAAGFGTTGSSLNSVGGAATSATGAGSTSGFGGSPANGGSAPSFGAGAASSATAAPVSNPFGGASAASSTTGVTTPVANEPYNPFAAKMGSAPSSTSGANGASGALGTTQTSSTNVPMGSQPATEKFSKMAGAKKPSMLTVILGILAVVSLVMAIVFAVLWQQALANEKIDYVPPANDGGNVSQTVSMITCTKDLGTDMVEVLPGLTGHNLVATVNFANDELGSVVLMNKYNFADAAAAEATQAYFNDLTDWYSGLATELGVAPIGVSNEATGTTVSYGLSATPAQFAGDYIAALGLVAGADGKVDGSRDSVQANYEAAGYTCVED